MEFIFELGYKRNWVLISLAGKKYWAKARFVRNNFTHGLKPVAIDKNGGLSLKNLSLFY